MQKEKPSLPVYTADEVAKHDSADNRVWVTHKVRLMGSLTSAMLAQLC